MTYKYASPLLSKTLGCTVWTTSSAYVYFDFDQAQMEDCIGGMPAVIVATACTE